MLDALFDDARRWAEPEVPARIRRHAERSGISGSPCWALRVADDGWLELCTGEVRTG